MSRRTPARSRIHLRTAGGEHALGVENVLQSHGHTVDQTELITPLDFFLPLPGRRQHGIPVDGDPRLKVAVQRVDARQQRLRQRHRRQGSFANLRGGFRHRKLVEFRHHSTSWAAALVPRIVRRSPVLALVRSPARALMRQPQVTSDRLARPLGEPSNVSIRQVLVSLDEGTPVFNGGVSQRDSTQASRGLCPGRSASARFSLDTRTTGPANRYTPRGQWVRPGAVPSITGTATPAVHRTLSNGMSAVVKPIRERRDQLWRERKAATRRFRNCPFRVWNRRHLPPFPLSQSGTLRQHAPPRAGVLHSTQWNDSDSQMAP